MRPRILKNRMVKASFVATGSLLLLVLHAAPAEEEESAPIISNLPEAAPGPVDFERDIEPILTSRCLSCHGPEKVMGGLRLHTRELVLAGSDDGPVIIEGQSAKSRLVHLVAGLDSPRMPLQGQPLSTREIGLLRAWIDAGAPWGGEGQTADPIAASRHWAFQPIHAFPEPVVRHSDWVRNPIDAFVLDRLEKEGLEPSPETDRATLMRRLYLDLLGLPPQPSEIAAFLDDHQPGSYERLVGRVLDSPHFGERWARHWLDLARYADSDGFEKDTLRPHAWRYREWVIDAYNRDLPYDQFVTQQIAGDLLPSANLETKVATGFHRNTLTNTEGGVDPEQYRVEQVVDRTNTTGLVFLGLTVGCAQCHSHKYDPITQREYYQLYAFFNQAMEQDIPAPLEEEIADYERALQEWERKFFQLKAAVQEQKKRIVEDTQASHQLAAWEAELDYTPPDWVLLEPISFSSSGGAALQKQSDGSLLATGHQPERDRYTVITKTTLTGIHGFRIEALPDPSLPAGGPGRAPDGGFVLSELKISAARQGRPTGLANVSFQAARSDFELKDFEADKIVDGDTETGWRGAPGPNEDPRHQAVVLVHKSAGYEGGTLLSFTLEHLAEEQQTLGRFRLWASSADKKTLERVFPPEVERALATAPEQRSEWQRQAMLEYWAERHPHMKERKAALEDHRVKKPQPPYTKAQTLAANPRPPETYLHIRGDFKRRGERVQPDSPAVLPPLKARGKLPDRLDLANWLMYPANPLTSRVAVNRVWQHLFGRGLVATSEDFGTRGESPSHPELLDWLATRFIRRGWSHKELVREIVTSSAYRQSSRIRTDLMERDPKNRLLARQSRFRLEAEATRDLFLSVSGLLNPRVGGPGIRPPLPEDVTDLKYGGVTWETSEGAERYRRGLYIFFQRTLPYPMLMIFDSPDSNTACVRRNRSNTPLQALTLLNDPVFVECHQAFGRRILEESSGHDEERIRYGFRLALGRQPGPRELQLLSGLLDDQRKLFREDLENSEKLVAEHQPAEVDPGEAAAWVALGRTILNLDEFVTRE